MKKMNAVDYITVGLAAGGFSLLLYSAYRRKKLIDEVNENQRHLVSIFAAGIIMNEKIQNGEYDGKTLDDIETDFEFYRITSHLQTF